jgi:integrase
MRFRCGNITGKIRLGKVDLTRRQPVTQPVIGQWLILAEARTLASQILAQRDAGVDVFAAYRGRRSKARGKGKAAFEGSFTASAKDFIEQHAKTETRGWVRTAAVLGLDEALNVKPGSLCDRWASRDVKDINAHDLHSVIEEARVAIPGTVSKRGPSDSRQRKCYDRLSQMFGWLARKRRIDVNPMRDLCAPAGAKERDRVLSTPEIAKVWKAFDNAGEPAASVLRLLLLTGARLNEIAQLSWSEVSEDGTTLTLPGNRTKNGRPFTLVLPPMAQALLVARQRDGEYAFSVTSGLTPISLSRAKVKTDEAAGIAPWRLHDLRRTAATGMAEIGIAPHIVEAVLNHVSGHKNGVAGIYKGAAYAEDKKAALAKWADHVRSVIGK